LRELLRGAAGRGAVNVSQGQYMHWSTRLPHALTGCRQEPVSAECSLVNSKLISFAGTSGEEHLP
jgi:hypothetical protein